MGAQALWLRAPPLALRDEPLRKHRDIALNRGGVFVDEPPELAARRHARVARRRHEREQRARLRVCFGWPRALRVGGRFAGPPRVHPLEPRIGTFTDHAGEGSDWGSGPTAATR